MKNRVSAQPVKDFQDFRSVLLEPLQFKIRVLDPTYSNDYPEVFEYGRTLEYQAQFDVFLRYELASVTSESAVGTLDTMWQHALSKIVGDDSALLLNQHDCSSKSRLRPDFTLTSAKGDVIYMKGEAKSGSTDIRENAEEELLKKLHPSAHTKFASSCTEIPAVMTNGEAIHLYGISHVNGKYVLTPVREYNITQLSERILFVRDVFSLARHFQMLLRTKL